MGAIALFRMSDIIDYSLPRLTTSATVGAALAFNPEGRNAQGVTRWVNRAGGIAIGYPSFTMQVRPPTKDSRVYKVSVKFLLPTLEQTSPSTASGIQPAPTKAYDCACFMEWVLPERSTLGERQSLFSQVSSWFTAVVNANDGSPTDNTLNPLKAAIETFEDVY
jgi:hypothetical protein